VSEAGASIDAVVAVDWSGALAGSERKIWLCQVEGGGVVRLDAGRTRGAVVGDVIATARRVRRLAAGFDFAFSPPGWFLGADQVGTGSVRGMPALARLATAGFAVWPFDAPRPGEPVAVEIWPRPLYAEPVVKSSAGARAAYLARHAPDVPDAFRAAAARSDDAFDALTAALAMWHRRDELATLGPAGDETERVEGRIWGA